jgi:hypothetical protein
VRAGTWGTNASRYTNPTSGFGAGGAGTYSVQFGTTACTLESQTFATSPGDRFRLAVRSMFYWVSPTPSASSVRASVEWLNATGTLLSTSAFNLGATQGQEFVTNSTELTPPTGAAFGRVVCGRFATTAASELFVLSDVKIERLIDPGTGRVGTGAIADGAVTSAKLDTSVGTTGNLGAGIQAPTARLHVSTTTANDGVFLAGASSLWSRFIANMGAGAYNNIIAASDRAIVYGGSASGSPGGGFSIAPWATGPSGLRLDSAGNVGVGTSSPLSAVGFSALTVQNTAAGGGGIVEAKDSATSLRMQTSGGGFGDVGTYTNHSLRFIANSAERARVTTTSLLPGADNTYTLGATGVRWSQVWAANATIQTSDERQKADVADSDLGLAFVEALRPVRYRWKVGQNVIERRPDGEDEKGNPRFREMLVPQAGRRPHYGFLAQQVEQAMGERDFAGFIFDPTEDVYGLRYEEFIAPLVKAVQELSARVRELEQQLAGTKDVTE